MPFKLNFHPYPCDGTLQYNVQKKVDDGRFTKVVRVHSGEIKNELPNPDYLSLDAQLKAGVQAREINPKLLSPSDKVRYEMLSQFNDDYEAMLKVEAETPSA